MSGFCLLWSHPLPPLCTPLVIGAINNTQPHTRTHTDSLPHGRRNCVLINTAMYKVIKPHCAALLRYLCIGQTTFLSQIASETRYSNRKQRCRILAVPWISVSSEVILCLHHVWVCLQSHVQCVFVTTRAPCRLCIALFPGLQSQLTWWKAW